MPRLYKIRPVKPKLALPNSPPPLNRHHLLAHEIRRARTNIRVQELPNRRFVVEELRAPGRVNDVFLAYREAKSAIAVAHAGDHGNLPSK